MRGGIGYGEWGPHNDPSNERGWRRPGRYGFGRGGCKCQRGGLTYDQALGKQPVARCPPGTSGYTGCSYGRGRRKGRGAVLSGGGWMCNSKPPFYG